MKPGNIQVLYNFVKNHPIKRVLDLGTGIGASAAIVALALKEKGADYHIDSLEQFDKCVKIAQTLIPKELQEHLTIHKSEVKIISFPEIPYHYFSSFSFIPEEDYDLIINDGPGPFLENDKLIDLPNGTIMEMLSRIKSGAFVVWDGRSHMLKFLERYYADNFWLTRPRQQNSDNLNILERKDNPVLFKDTLLEDYKTTVYFKDNEDKKEDNEKETSFTPDGAAASSVV